MRKLIYFTICTAGMIGFWYLIRFFVIGIDPMFGHGFATGVALFVILFWLGERLGAFFVVEPSKGTWTPHRD